MYKRISPDSQLKDLVKEYWIIEDEETYPGKKKIIPDGFPEIIFHYGDLYRIKLSREWETQSRYLFSGQISKHFFLENTGKSGMLGIKLMPVAPYKLAGLDMSAFTDRVVPLDNAFQTDFRQLKEMLKTDSDPEEKASFADSQLSKLFEQGEQRETETTQKAVQMIREDNGLIKIESVAGRIGVSRRHLEREFKKIVGLTPKYFSRIIRFSYIFENMKEGNESWIEVALGSGYFDQSHFIKEFKAFTGEDPSRYGFDEQNMANFFLKREE